MRYIAQKGTKVVVVEADAAADAAALAAKALKLPTRRPRRLFDRNDDFDWGNPGHVAEWQREIKRTRGQAKWLYDWRGHAATFRTATAQEAEMWDAARRQHVELRGLTYRRLREKAAL